LSLPCTQALFETDQAAHHEKIKASLSKFHEQIRALLASSYETFKNDGEEVRLDCQTTSLVTS